jgi:hypothetical protein
MEIGANLGAVENLGTTPTPPAMFGRAIRIQHLTVGAILLGQSSSRSRTSPSFSGKKMRDIIVS